MPKPSGKKYKKVEAVPKFEIGSANVFADIGVANPGAALAKADVARRIASGIRQRGLIRREPQRHSASTNHECHPSSEEDCRFFR